DRGPNHQALGGVGRPRAEVPRAQSPGEHQQDGLMTDTVISSATREVVIGLERPFVMIGERINPTGRKILAAEMAAGNFSRVEADALGQASTDVVSLLYDCAPPYRY